MPRPRLGDRVPQFNHEAALYDKTLRIAATAGKHRASRDWHEVVYTQHENLERYGIRQRVWRQGRGEETPDDLRNEVVEEAIRKRDGEPHGADVTTGATACLAWPPALPPPRRVALDSFPVAEMRTVGLKAMAQFALKLISEPAEGTRSVLVTDRTDEEFVFMRGDATDDSYNCGSCGRPLVVGVSTGQVGNMVFRCPRCGSFNEI